MKYLIVSVCLLSYMVVKAQEQTLSLDDCIQKALDRNIQIKQAKNNELIAEANRFQSIMNFFPSVSAGINYDYFFGNFFDTNAARQVSETTNSSNPNVSAGLVLFNGFANHANFKQNKYQAIAAVENTKGVKLSVQADILTFYLNVILDEENIKIAKDRLDLLTSQLEREQKRNSVGVGSLESIYNLESQIANQKLTVINLQNTRDRDLLALFQAMQLDATKDDVKVAGYDVEEAELMMEVPPFEVVLEESLSASPALRAAKSSLEASRFQLKAAKAQVLPSINAFGRIGSNYSSNGARNPSTGEFEADATFSDQIEYNEFQYINFQLSIPIFSRYQNRNQIQVAKLSAHNAELDVEQTVNTVTNIIQSVYLDLVNAQQTYASAKENLASTSKTFEFMKKRFESGNSDFYTYLESLNNKNRAEIELITAKYGIIFRKKILELYSGS